MSASAEPESSRQNAAANPGLAGLDHRRCFACGAENPAGLRLRFVPVGKDESQCRFVARSELQGYDGILQGGVVATLLDSVMTNVLLQRGIAARTAELEIRFRRPVPVAKRITVRGKLEESRGKLHVVSSQILRGGKVLADARAKFMATS